MKKWLGLCLVMVMMVLAACGGDTAKESDTKASVAGDDNATKEQSEDVRLIAGTVVLANIMDRLDLDAIAVPDTAKELPARKLTVIESLNELIPEYSAKRGFVPVILIA